MKRGRQTQLVIAMALGIFLVACSDDDSPAADTGPAPDTVAPKDSGAKDLAAKDSAPKLDMAKDVSIMVDMAVTKDTGPGSDSVPALVRVEGQVYDAGTSAGLVGATVSVDGASPPNTTTSTTNGTYSLQVKPGSTITLKAEKGSYLTYKRSLVTGTTDTQKFILVLVGNTTGDALLAAAGLPKRDATKGAVMVTFDGASNKGGESATLSAKHDGSITVGAGSVPTKSTKLVAGGQNTLIFSNVVTGSTTVTFSATTGTCTPTYPSITSYKVEAGVITGIDATCK